jgi:hypothetical protein
VLSAVFEAVAHLLSKVSWLLLPTLFIAIPKGELSHSSNSGGFVYLEFF